MRTRLLVAAVILGQGVLGVQPAQAVGVFVQLFPLTGEIRLRNFDASPAQFILYSIKSDSAAGGLNGSSAVWKSITDNYDASGNGFIDPTGNWSKISSTSMELTEGVFGGSVGTLPGMRAISLGNIWDPGVASAAQISIDVRDPGNQPVGVKQLALDGDYSGANGVDDLDYDIWRQFYGSTSILLADGNLNGVVDVADYVVWRDNYGKSIASFSMSNDEEMPGAALVVGADVPEPASAMLLILACAGLLAWMASGACRAIAVARAPLAARGGGRRCALRR